MGAFPLFTRGSSNSTSILGTVLVVRMSVCAQTISFTLSCHFDGTVEVFTTCSLAVLQRPLLSTLHLSNSLFSTSTYPFCACFQCLTLRERESSSRHHMSNETSEPEQPEDVNSSSEMCSGSDLTSVGV